jgi:hypothetical protein
MRRRRPRRLLDYPATVANALNHIVKMGIVKEVSGRQRDRLFAYSRHVSVVSGRGNSDSRSGLPTRCAATDNEFEKVGSPGLVMQLTELCCGCGEQ